MIHGGLLLKRPGAFGRRVAHAAEKRMQRNVDARSEMRDAFLLVERNDFHFRVRKIVGEVAASRAERVVGVGNRQLDFLDADFEHVARLRVFDVDRSGENVPARPLCRFTCVGDVAQRLLDLLRRQPRILEPLRARSDQRLQSQPCRPT